MSRFRQTEKRSVPGLNTASLPDLIFTILFFFMIVTNMRTVAVMTQFDIPKASELQKLEEKKLLIYIFVGHRFDGEAQINSNWDIQLDSDFVTIDNLPALLEEKKQQIALENQDKLTVVMKIDKDAPMGIVNDIKQCLRKANLLTIHYAVNSKRSTNGE